MRILQLHTRYRQRGGEDAVVETEAELLRAAGHEVITHLAENPSDGLAAARSFAAAPWNPLAARRVQQDAARRSPDVVHVHNTWFALTPSVLGPLRELGLPVVATLHNYRLVCAAATLFRDGAPCTDCVGSHPGHAVRHGCYRGSSLQSAVAAGSIALQAARGTWHRDVDRFLALTEFGRRQFIEGGLPADRLEVKSNSVADPGPRHRPPSASRRVVFLGRLSEEKGLGVLLEAWRRAASSLELVVVGTGPMGDTLRASAPAGVRFLGSLSPEQVRSLLLEARALVFPSVWFEGQGLVALEAAAARLPVLLSDLGAMTELFAPHAHNLLMAPGDPSAVAAAIARLEDDAFVDTHGELTRRCYEERYTHRVALERLEATYRAVIAERARHGT